MPVGGAILGASAISAGASLIGGNKQANIAKDTARDQIEASQQQFEQTRQDFEPFRLLGTSAINPLANLLYGTNISETLEATPGFNFALEQGANAVDAGAANSGLLNSGARAKALTEFGQGLATRTLGNERNALFNALNIGTGSAANTAQAGQANVANINNALGNAALSRQDAAQQQFSGIGNALGSGLGALSTMNFGGKPGKSGAFI